MRSSNPTARGFFTSIAFVWLASSLLYLGGGCASGTAARNDSALNAYVQGVRAYQNGETDKAMASLQDAISKKNDLVMARSMLGDIYRARARSKADFEPAREQYEVVARLDPYEFSNHYRLGFVYQLLERLQDAAASYLKALDLKPTDAPSNMYLGTVFLSMGESRSISPEERAALRQKAVQYGQRAAELNPQWSDAQANLGVAQDATGQYGKAETAYRKALDLDSGNNWTRLLLGENLLAQKKFGEARSVLSELVKVEDNPLNRKRLGDAYAGEEKFAEAINQYQAALKIDSNYYPALNEIGASYIAEYKKGLGLDDAKRKAALDVWQQSLAINRAQARIMALVQQYSKAPMFQK